MTAQQLKEAREALGLTQTQLAQALRMGPNGRRTVGRWESGEGSISGPASVAIELLVKTRRK
jgi:transcriptional regulator with XRE-family HTH domain